MRNSRCRSGYDMVWRREKLASLVRSVSRSSASSSLLVRLLDGSGGRQGEVETVFSQREVLVVGSCCRCGRRSSSDSLHRKGALEGG